MASIIFDKRMVYFKILVAGNDMTKVLGPYVSSIKIKHTIMPKVQKNHNTGIPPSPTSADISITSKSYIEDIFIENLPIEIYMGYDFVYQPLAFKGIVATLPEGSAKEMLTYTVKCISEEIKLGYKDKSRVFRNKKSEIIQQICSENSWQSDIRIADQNVIEPRYQHIAIAKTDLEILYQYAKDWSCVCWFNDLEKKVFFVDADIAHSIGDSFSLPAQTEVVYPNGNPNVIKLGYRSTMSHCNVKQVDWKHKTGRSTENIDGGLLKWSETSTDSDREGKVLYDGQVWQLKKQYLLDAQQNPLAFKSYFAIVASEITYRGEEALKTYFAPLPENGLFPNKEPNFCGTGMEVIVYLNYGVPEWRPPRSATLYHGSLNPMADGAHLPAWLSRYKFKNYIGLSVNEMELNFSNGEMESVLHCSLSF